jgi:hypothetical protein
MDERRKYPRLESEARVLWTIVGKHDLQIDRLRDVSQGGALVATESIASVGQEVRFDLLDDDGEKFASGLGRITRVESRGMGISFLALGIDAVLLATLSTASRARPRRFASAVSPRRLVRASRELD